MVCGKGNGNESIVSFILHSPAPLYAAVKLSNHFRAESTKFKERSKDLVLAGDACEELAVDILTLACANDASKLLNAVDDNGKTFLDVLVDCEQKHCVAHTAVQSYLGSKWRAGRNWKISKVLFIFFVAFFVPPLWVGLSLPWNNNYSRVPLVKFICQLISHLYLMLLFLFMLVIPTGKSPQDLIPAWYEVLLLFWLCGLVLTQLTDPQNSGGLGRVPLFIVCLSAVGVVVHLAAIPFDHEETRSVIVYTRNQIFALAMFLTFVQLLDFLTFHHLFGPWGVIIGNLMQDLARFIVILLIFVLGFTAHLAAITRPTNNTTIPGGVKMAENVLKIFKTLCFSLFGAVEIEKLENLAEHAPVATLPTVLVNIAFCFYALVTIIVLINLLIAMMSDTYQRIQAQSDLEWKFGRAKLIRKLERSTRTPAPLNLFTTAVAYVRFYHKMNCKCCRPDLMEILNEEANDGLSMHHIFTSTNSVSPEATVGMYNNEHAHTTARIEQVVNWARIVKKYKALRGMEEVSNEKEVKQAVVENSKSVHDIKELVEGLLMKMNVTPQH